MFKRNHDEIHKKPRRRASLWVFHVEWIVLLVCVVLPALGKLIVSLSEN